MPWFGHYATESHCIYPSSTIAEGVREAESLGALRSKSSPWEHARHSAPGRNPHHTLDLAVHPIV